jgi:hypothetical protein
MIMTTTATKTTTTIMIIIATTTTIMTTTRGSANCSAPMGVCRLWPCPWQAIKR